MSKELQAIRHSQATEQTLFQLVTENASDVIVRPNQERRWLYVSPSCREVLGFTQGELLNGGAFDLVHQDDLPGVLELFASFGPEDPVRDATWGMRL